jgi:uncharacterized protein
LTNQQELPLFPLNTVLFPGMPLYLHIFEPRYKLMIQQCVNDSMPFGVVLIRRGSEVGSGAEIFDIGTTALITQQVPLARGEMNIAALGHRRFRVLGTHMRNPYLTGYVESLPPLREGHSAVGHAAQKLGNAVKKYLDFYAALGEVDFKLDKLPEDPESMAYLAAIVLHIPASEKQSLLSFFDLMEMIKTEQRILSREALILRHLIEKGKRWRDDPSIFSLN